MEKPDKVYSLVKLNIAKYKQTVVQQASKTNLEFLWFTVSVISNPSPVVFPFGKDCHALIAIPSATYRVEQPT